jgi:hypothetical protein
VKTSNALGAAVLGCALACLNQAAADEMLIDVGSTGSADAHPLSPGWLSHWKLPGESRSRLAAELTATDRLESSGWLQRTESEIRNALSSDDHLKDNEGAAYTHLTDYRAAQHFPLHYSSRRERPGRCMGDSSMYHCSTRTTSRRSKPAGISSSQALLTRPLRRRSPSAIPRSRTAATPWSGPTSPRQKPARTRAWKRSCWHHCVATAADHMT